MFIRPELSFDLNAACGKVDQQAMIDSRRIKVVDELGFMRGVNICHFFDLKDKHLI